jgi:TolB-like protein/Flp pilus assembly protein TadD
MPESGGAVFLSYASADAEAVRRLCEALRSADIEVWFDQHELKGGDAWDLKLRKQIAACALFVPVISANTEARKEGYFRLEWKLAEDRSHQMARGTPFIVPVCLDATTEAVALVPDAFLAVQWTRLPGGVVTSTFLNRLQGLLRGGSEAPLIRRRVTSNRAHPSAEGRLAVLPFVNMSSDAEQEFFSDGLSEELLNLLAKVPGLRVTSRGSAFAFKGRSLRIPEIAEQLNVAHVLEGSVRQAGSRLRIKAQLTDACSDTLVWSETYDRTFEDIFAVQDEIAGAVVTQLKAVLLGTLPRARAADPRAYSIFLQARQVFRQGTAAATSHAVALFEEALAIEPDYPEALDGLAVSYIWQSDHGPRPVSEGYELARRMVRNALAAAPDFALGHARLGWIALTYDGDLHATARHFEHALRLEPANPQIIGSAAILVQNLGRLEQAIALKEFVIERDPVVAAAHATLATAYRLAGRFDASIASLRTALRLSPDRVAAYYGIGCALVLKGEPQAALEAMQLERNTLWRLIGRPIAYHALGRTAESDAALTELIEKFAAPAAFNIAYVVAYRGEVDRAFEWLDRAVEHRDPGLAGILTEPLLANLREDPRWLPLLRRVGKAPEQVAAISFDFSLPAR